MKTIRIILSEAEVTQALVEYAYEKSGRTRPTITGNVETIMVFENRAGVTIVKQARVEMELCE